MGNRVEFTRPDGKPCPGYLAEPSGGSTAPGIVVIQEWWGLNPQICSVADRWAQAGFRALVPDLFRGKLTKDAQEASHLMNGLDFGDAATQDIRGALQYIKQLSAKAAVSGFCMGGALTLLSAVKLDELDGAICFYGIPPAQFADPATIDVPLQCHFAQQDDWCTPEAVDALEAKLQSGNVDYELYRYDAAHAFMNQDRPEVYSDADAKVAWERAIRFMKAL